ncbi:MAG: hypothetical protein PVF58_13895 [Candidatus Methanofastidiosia archaeon]|jgi:hypothetical protein
MNGKQILFAVICGALVLSTVTPLTAGLMSDTPLYTVRMEQVCNKMNFLTEQNTFTYATTHGYSLNALKDTIDADEWPPDTIGRSGTNTVPDTIGRSGTNTVPETTLAENEEPPIDWPPDTIC